MTNVVRLMDQDIVGSHENTQDIFNQVESLENKQNKNNVRLKNLKEQAEGANLQDYGAILR